MSTSPANRPDRRQGAAQAPSAPATPRQGALAAFEEGVREHMRGASEAAAAAYRRAIALDASFPEPHNNLAALLADRGETEAAIALVERAVELEPGYAEALHNGGLLTARLGRFAEACGYFEKALERSGEQAAWWNDLGNARLESFDFQGALDAYDRAVELDAALIAAVSNRANALRGLRRPQEALEACDRALGIDPTYAHAANNRGLLLKEGGQREAAIATLEGALALDPTNAALLTNLAVVHMELADLDRAKKLAGEAVRHDPSHVDAQNVLGNCAMEEGDYEGAMGWYRRAAALRPDDCNANWNQSLIHLVRGEFEQGWAKFGWRTRLHSALFDRHRDTTPEWDGSPLAGRSILLYAEQGLGDSIQFIRYAPILKSLGAREVLVDCPAAAVPLLERVDGVDRVISRGDPLPPHDLHSYMLSLPGILGTREETIPADVPYLPVEPRVVTRLIDAQDGRLRVGIVWAGGSAHQRDRIRSAGLEGFRALLATPGVRFYSLQKGPPEAELRPEDGIVDLSPHLHDLLDTAAAISHLDLVITVDTSVAHLAGGLGRATWVLLPSTPDWRWMLDRSDSPWYPTMRLFRQPAVGAWAPVFASVAEELRGLAPATEPRALRGAVSFRHPGADPAAGGRGEAPVDPAELEFCRFLREALAPGDVFIDYHPGAGAASLAAATAAGAPVIPVLMVEPDAEAAARWRERALAHGLKDVLTVVNDSAAGLDGLATLAGTRCFLRIGSVEAAERVLHAARPLVDGSLAAVLWPSAEGLGRAEIERLLPAGFHHCSLAMRDGELAVDPMGDDPHARVSIAGWLLAALGAADGTPQPSPAPSPAPIRIPAPAGFRGGVGIDWQIGTSTGWGTYGANLALELAAGGELCPILLGGSDTAALAPMARHLLAPAVRHSQSVAEALARAPGARFEADFPVLHGLGNNLEGIDSGRLSASRAIGLVFLEDTQLTGAALDRGRAFDRIVAGSTWNAELLRGHGLENVRVSLQGIDTTVFRPGPRSGRLRDRFVIYSGGKLEYRKGQDIVVAAFREFQRRHPEALLVFAWHNFWPGNMEEITFGGHVEGLPGVASNGKIDFSGWLLRNGLPRSSFLDLEVVPNAQMGQLLREADVALFTNRCEGGTNLVAMEAMACGVPTVLSANTGHLDLVAPERCYPLERQGRVNPSRHCAGVEGWGESSVEEVVAVLERVHADSADAATRARAGSLFMEGLSWRNQVARLVDTISDLL